VARGIHADLCDVAEISNSYVVWTPYATAPPGQYVLGIDDSAGSFAFSSLFNLLGPGGASGS